MSAGLKVGDPKRNNNCIFGDKDCIVDSKNQCDKQGVIYRIECDLCNAVVDTNSEASNKERDNLKPCYVGLTRTSLHNRLLSHKKLMKSKDNSNPLHRHNVEAHNGEVMSYTCKIIGREKKIVRLFMREALEIERLTKHQIMNGKQELGRGGMVRLHATRIT